MNRAPVLVLLGLALAAALLLAAPQPAAAGGVVGNGKPASCTESALDAALLGGGQVTFDCGPAPHIIQVTSAKVIKEDTSLDGGELVTLSGGDAVRVFEVVAGARLMLANLTIAQGLADGGSGGGIFNEGAIEVSNCTFSDNNADSFGGAILNYGTATVTASRFGGNRAGINGGAIDTIGQLDVERSAFLGNYAGFRGGAINNYMGTITVERTAFTGNGSDGYGGGLVNDGGTATVQASSFDQNFALDVGGGIRNSGTLYLQDSTLAGNQANRGGAVENSGTLHLVNSTLSGNSGGDAGGGILNQPSAYAGLTSATLLANVAFIAGGGNIENGGTLEIGNSLVVNGSNFNCAGAITSLGNNMESGMDCGFTAAGDLQNTEPSLTPLQDNGGPTYTHDYLDGSRGIDEISAVVCPFHDQRGLARPQGADCDMGAVEHLAEPPLTSSYAQMPWPMAGHDARHSGQGVAPGPDDPKLLTAPWPFVASDQISAAPAIDYAGAAYFGANDGRFTSVDRLGGLRFTFTAGGALRASPALIPVGAAPMPGEEYTPPPMASVYFGADDGQLYALSSDGTPAWQLAPGATPNTSPLRSAPVVDKLPGTALNRIFVGAGNGKLYAVNETTPTTAVTAWEQSTGAPLTTSPALSPNGQFVYAGGADGLLYCFEAANGNPLPGSPANLNQGALRTPVVNRNGMVFVATEQGKLFAFDRNCRLLPYWRVDLGASIRAAPALGKDGELLAIAGNTLYGISAFGVIAWIQSFSRPVGEIAPIVDSSGVVYVATGDGWLIAVSHQTGAPAGTARWAIQVAPPGSPYLGPPALDPLGRIYMPAAANHLEVIDDQPAFQLMYHGQQMAPGNQDIYSLRETYGVVDPARTLRYTSHAAAESQPAYSLDRNLTAFVSDRAGSADVFLADGIVSQEQNLTRPAAGAPFTFSSQESGPAFSPINDLTGVSRLRDRRRYVALTTTASGADRLAFLDLDAHARGTTLVLGFTAWALSQGVPSNMAQLLESPNSRQSQIAFSPDGRRVAWRQCDDSQNKGYVLLLTMEGAASRVEQVGLPIPIETGKPCEDFAPTFAPDSRWLAMQEAGSLAIYPVDSPGSPLFATQGPLNYAPLHPSWSPDGSQIAVASNIGVGFPQLFALREAQYSQARQLTPGATSDEPFYNPFKRPAPVLVSISPDRQVPGGAIQLAGRGFDILHPEDNRVFFTDTLHSAWIAGEVLGAGVDPAAGMGVLTVRVPDLAGHGPIKVQTRVGVSTCCQFYVLPKPASVQQPHSVPGAKVRVSGVGFDLTPATQHTVLFSKAGGGWVSAAVISGTLSGSQELLVVQVPPGVAETGPIRVENPYGGSNCPCNFGLLHPVFTIRRTTGLPAYEKQGCKDVEVQVEGKDYPYDEYFGYGTTTAEMAIHTAGNAVPPVAITGTSPDFTASGPDTAGFKTSFSFPYLGSTHPGGDLTVHASDKQLPSAVAGAGFRVPLTNIPVIFVPGTSGVSLDISPGTPTPLLSGFVDLVPHTFPWICKTCLLGYIEHIPFTYLYNPGLWDPDGPRVWLGPEFINYIIADAALLLGIPDKVSFLYNRANHYLDVLAFDKNGANTLSPNSTIQAGTVMRRVNFPAGFSKPFYEDLYQYMTATLGRPLNSGTNGFYTFNYDWRGNMNHQAAALGEFVDQVLASTGAAKVVLMSHSLGGPVARTYYLSSPANAAKVDQLISLAGGFGGVGKPIKILAMGDSWGFFNWSRLGPLSFGFADWEVRDLARNWGTAYFQGPNSELWFEDDVSRGGSFDRRYIRDERSLIGVGRSHGAHTTWLANNYNGYLVDAADRFFDGQNPRLGDFSVGTGPVYHQRVLSLGIDTPVGFRVWKAPSMACSAAMLTGNPIAFGIECLVGGGLLNVDWYEPLLADGDETITYHGLLGKTLPYDDRTYVLRNIEHLELTKQANVHSLISSFLDGTVCSQPQSMALGFLPHNLVFERKLPSPASSRQATASGPADHWLLRVRGMAGLEVRDGQGRYTGPSSTQPSMFEMGIPGLAYNPGLTFSYVSITEAGDYTFDFSGVTPAALDIHLDPSAGAEPLDGYAYIGIPLQKDSRARLAVDTDVPAPGALQVDYDGDGTFEQTYPPQTLDPSASADTTTPQTAIALSPDRTVTLTATDDPGGSGVLRTHYSADGATFRVYEGPFALPPATVAITAISIDRNGNIETPAATLVVGHQLFLPIVTK